MTSKPTLARFPWRHGNQFRLLVDADSFFPAILAAIDGARVSVLIEMYLVESGRVADRFIDALCAAAGRGVGIQMLLDGFGSRGLQAADSARLRRAGIDLVLYNPITFTGSLRRNLFRDHRKLIVVDGDYAFCGGAGITDDFDHQRSGQPPWHDVMIEIRGPLVADWQQVFAHNWTRWSDTPPLPTVTPVKAGQHVGRVSLAGSKTPVEVKRALLQQLRRARQRAWIATAYFVPSWKLRRRLARAARRGIDVRLLLPGQHTDHPAVRHAGRRFYRRLLRSGVRIFEYQPRFQHAKVALIDDWVAIGSSNLDRWNLRWNLEANQEVDAADFATTVHAMFQTDFGASHEILHDSWHQRPWYGRLAERFWGTVDRWLDRHARH